SSKRVVYDQAWVAGVSPKADDVVAFYPVGAAVTVYYNPRTHDEAVLEPGRYGVGLGELGLGAFLIISGLWGLSSHGWLGRRGLESRPLCLFEHQAAGFLNREPSHPRLYAFESLDSSASVRLENAIQRDDEAKVDIDMNGRSKSWVATR